MGRAALEVVLKETVRRNRVREGLVYLQITRGVAPRDHAFPNPPVPPSMVIARPKEEVRLSLPLPPYRKMPEPPVVASVQLPVPPAKITAMSNIQRISRNDMAHP